MADETTQQVESATKLQQQQLHHDDAVSKEEVCFLWAAYTCLADMARKREVVRLTKRGVAMALHRSFEATRERVSEAGKALLGRVFFMKLWRSEAF